MAATSLDALEALLQLVDKERARRPSPVPAVPVPNPLDPAQPHLIECDVSTPIGSRRAFGSGAMSAFSPTRPPAVAAPVVVTSVPNPLATPVAEHPPQPGPPPISASKPSAPLPRKIKIAAHGFGLSQTAVPTPSPRDAAPRQPVEVEISSDKVLHALNSKPQRGKKRQNLSDLERQELTRTRNREHARSTRMKKKVRLQELVEIEQKYLLLKEKETLDLRRREQLVELVENAGLNAKTCSHSSRLSQLASRELRDPEFAVAGGVALTTEESGMVKVAARGTDLQSGETKTMSGVISVDFNQSTADICSVSLCWSSLESLPSGGIFPSVSALSFES